MNAPTPGPRITRERLVFLLLTCVYAAVFAWTYARFTFDQYGYLGFGYRGADPSHLLRYFVLALIPAALMPVTIRRPSQIFLYIQFFLVYIPALWMVSHSALPVLPPGQQAQLLLALLAGMLILLWALRSWKLLSIPRIEIPERLTWTIVYAGAAGCLALLFVLFQGQFQLINLREIYVVRYAASETLEAADSHAGAYAFSWLVSLFLPLLFVRGLARASLLVLAGVIAAYVFLFGIWGSKTALVAPLLLIGGHWFASQPPARMPLVFVVALVVVLLVPFALPFEDGLGNLVRTFWIGIVHMRTFAVPGLAFVQYVGFFGDHPITFGSHITGLNLLLPYPYDYDIPRTIGYHYYGDLMTANANFWTQDGIAGFGLVGIVGMSLVAAAVLCVLDSVTRHLSPKVVLTALVGVLVTFANVSLFTSLLTGGLGLFMLLCLLLPADAARNDAARAAVPSDPVSVLKGSG
ncbi:MAG: hypothetical protein ACRETT_00655 [Steroidobacteraceae bacterium]